jgi:hypothetical protein
MSDPSFQQYVLYVVVSCITFTSMIRYAHRLQANLTWIAAAADQKVSYIISLKRWKNTDTFGIM